MRITKRQLRRIIKEERAKLLKEELGPLDNAMNIISDMTDELAPIVYKYIQDGLDESDMNEAWEAALGDYIS